MIYNKKYKIDPADVVDKTIKWKNTGSGTFVIGKYNGKKYFIKRYNMGPRLPSKSIPEPVFSELKGEADRLEKKQAEIKKRLRDLTPDTDFIVVPEDIFWDENIFTTVTQFIPDEVRDYDFTSLDAKSFIKVCRDMTERIRKIHDAGVTHGDLKEKNYIFCVKGGKIRVYLIDFDSSYPSDYSVLKDSAGDSLLGHPATFTEGYQSPEIAIYNYEDKGVIDAATISQKTDIFTLAVIFHKLWTGEFPSVIGDACAVGEAVYLDRELKLSGKFDAVLGDKNGCKFSSLLKWMLTKDPAVRPTAQQVMDALEDKLDVTDYYEGGEAVDRFDTVPHPIHESSMEILSAKELKELGVKTFLKVTEGGMYKYYVKLKDGTEYNLSADEVIAKGYASAKSTTLGTLWPEDADKIEFTDVAGIAAEGVLAIEPKEAGYKRFYYVALRAGGGYTTSAKGLVDRGLARPKSTGTVSIEIGGGDTPWEDHGTAYNKEALAERNVVKVEKVVDDGDNKYRLTTLLPDGSYRENIVKIGYMRIMKFIK